MSTNTNIEEVIVKTKSDNSGLNSFRQGVKNSRDSISDLGNTAKNVQANVEGIFSGLAIAGVGAFISKTIKAGAELTVLKENFEGTAANIELFKTATAGTVSDGDLIKLSNQASDLGVSLEDQALLFSLAEDAADKYGGGVESNFERVIAATDGSAKGLRAVGISTKAFSEELQRLLTVQGKNIDNMTAEEQLNIRLQAIYNLTGITLDKVKEKQKDIADQIESTNITISDSIDALGEGLAKGLNNFLQIIQDVVNPLEIFGSQTVKLTDIFKQFGIMLTQPLPVTFFNMLKAELQFVIDKVNELTGLKLFQDAATKGKLQQITQGTEDVMQFDKYGNVILPKDYNTIAEQGTLPKGTKPKSSNSGTKEVKEKVEKTAIELILEAVSNVSKDYHVKNFIQDNMKISSEVSQPYSNFGIENVNKLLGQSEITPYKTGANMEETYNKSVDVFNNVQSLLSLLNSGTDTFVGKMLSFFSTINSILQAVSLVRSIVGIIGSFAGVPSIAGRAGSNVYLGLDLNSMQIYKTGKQEYTAKQNKIRIV